MDIKPIIGLFGVIVAAMASEFNDQVAALTAADIRGGLDISLDPGTWMNSLYISAEVVGMAISPWLLVTFTLRRFTLFVIALCCFSSVLIPFSPNMVAVDALRMLQGLAGGMTIPLLMTTALKVLTPEIRLYGLAVYALTATLTPALGEPMAALWTDIVGWRFVFFQAIPLCTLGALLVWYGLPQDQPDYQRFRILDWRGLLLVIIGFGALSTMLYQGDRLDWFNSPLICVLALVSVVAIPLLLVNEWFHPLPLMKLQLLGRRNFCYGAVALLLFLIIGQSASTIPLRFLSQVQGFRPIQTEVITMVIAASQLVMLPAMAVLLNYRWVDSRVVSFIGLALIIAACIGSSFVTLDWDPSQFLLWQGLQAIGQPMVVMPLLLMATNSVVPSEGPFASGLVNTPRALSEAASVWLLDLITRWRGGLHSNRIADQLGQDRWRIGIPGSPRVFEHAVRQQAMILTLSDAYLIMAAIAGALVIVLLLLPERTLPPRLQLAEH